MKMEFGMTMESEMTMEPEETMESEMIQVLEKEAPSFYIIYCDLRYHILHYQQSKDFEVTKMILGRVDLFDKFPKDRRDDLDKQRNGLLKFFEKGNVDKNNNPTEDIQAWFISVAQCLFFAATENLLFQNDRETRMKWREELYTSTGQPNWWCEGWPENAWEEGHTAPGWDHDNKDPLLNMYPESGEGWEEQ